MKRYTLLLFLFLALEAMAVAAFNIAADPFGTFGWCLPKYCQQRTQASTDLRRVDFTAIERVRPTRIVLGSSTALTGLRPETLPGNGPAYNLALTGASLQEMLWVLDYAHRMAPVHDAVIGLDFFMANARYRDRLTQPSAALPARAQRYLESVFSLHALQASLASLKHKSAAMPFIDGDGNQQIQPSFIAGKPGGYRAAFLAEEHSYLTGNGWFAEGAGFDLNDRGANTSDKFRQLVRYGYRNHIRLYLAFSPSHARFFSTLKQAGLEPYMLLWKAKLARINDEEARKAGATPFALWDFSIPSPITEEPLPGSPTGMMQHYVDSVHYTPAIGGLVEACLLHPTAQCNAFGAPLHDDAELMVRLAHSRDALAAYERTHAADMADIHQQMVETEKYRARLAPIGAQAVSESRAFLQRLDAAGK